jgi:hypothetical protein
MFKTSLVTEFASDAWEFTTEDAAHRFSISRGVLDTQRRIDAVFATSEWKAGHG